MEREAGVTVSVRRIQRSLERLVETGCIARQQRTKWWGQRDYWYSWVDAEWELQQHRPTAFARSSSVTAQTVCNRRSEASVPTVHILESPLNNQTSLNSEREVASQLGGKSAESGTRGTYKGQEPTSRARGSGNALDTLQRVVQRAEAKGFGACQDAEAPVQTEMWVDGDYRYTRLGSGHVVKDSLLTAPVR